MLSYKAGRTVNNDKCYADIANSTVKFDEKGDGLARYTIFNYQKKLEGAGYDYKVTYFFDILFYQFIFLVFLF